MSQSSTYPATKLLTLTNVTPWNIYLLELLFAYPDMGVAIRSGTPFELIKPTINDLFEDTDTRMYTFKRDGVTLTGESRKDFIYATKDYSKLEKGRKDEEAKVCALIVSSFSEEAKMQLRTNSAYIKAANDNNSFQMYTIAKAAHTRATSFAVAQHSFLQLLSLKMTSTFAEYIDRVLAQKDSFIAIFDPEGTGLMSIENILTMILVNGLPDDFKYMKDLMFSKDLMGEFPDFKETLQAMMTYDLNKQKVDVPSAIEAPPGPTILSASTTVPTNPAKTKCTICHMMFPKILRKDGCGEFTSCYPCSARAREARSAAAANPTPAQVKKAQAVILAANVAAKGPTSDSTIPPPTQRETSSINNYMELQHCSMTATTTIDDPAPRKPVPATPTPGLFILDSGSSLSLTPCMADIIDPLELTTPIHITGANGDIIYATHVGVSFFDPRHQVYFVPRSAAKLVSLGALSALGYTAHTGKDSSIVITASTGIILYSCPIQRNNTWIFPSHLLTGKTSPSITVLTGISDTSGANVLLSGALPHYQVPAQHRPLSPISALSATFATSITTIDTSTLLATPTSSTSPTPLATYSTPSAAPTLPVTSATTATSVTAAASASSAALSASPHRGCESY